MSDNNEESLESGVSTGRPAIKLEWLISAGTALSMIVGGVVAVTGSESRINTRLTTIETTRSQEVKADERRIKAYDTRIEALETESGLLRHELSIRREYARHVHAHVCFLLAKAHGPRAVETEAICSLPEPEFQK